MERKTFQFAFDDLKLSVAQIEDLMGYNEDDDREFVIGLIQDVLREARDICKIKAEYLIVDDIKSDAVNKTIELNNIYLNVKNIVFSQIKKSDSAALFICTAGEEIGKLSKLAMQERDLLKGYIYDLAGSEIVEAAADLLQADLEKFIISSGRKITNRYSPGYCGWDVDEQHKLFRFFPDNFCGISLSPSALMQPVKSVSGIIGVGKNVKHNPYTCRMCDFKDCIYRSYKSQKP